MEFRNQYDVQAVSTARSLSRKRFAQLIGVSERAVFDWERKGTRPRWCNLEKIEQFIEQRQPTIQHYGKP